MDTEQNRIDLDKVRIIQNCLGQLFHDLRISGETLNIFAFTNGVQSGQLKLHREFLDALPSPDKLREYMDMTVLPAIHANPDKRIEIDAQGALLITEK